MWVESISGQNDGYITGTSKHEVVALEGMICALDRDRARQTEQIEKREGRYLPPAVFGFVANKQEPIVCMEPFCFLVKLHMIDDDDDDDDDADVDDGMLAAIDYP